MLANCHPIGGEQHTAKTTALLSSSGEAIRLPTQCVLCTHEAYTAIFFFSLDSKIELAGHIFRPPTSPNYYLPTKYFDSGVPIGLKTLMPEKIYLESRHLGLSGVTVPAHAPSICPWHVTSFRLPPLTRVLKGPRPRTTFFLSLISSQ